MSYSVQKATKRGALWKSTTGVSSKCPTPTSVEELADIVNALTKRVDYLDGLVEEVIQDVEGMG